MNKITTCIIGLFFALPVSIRAQQVLASFENEAEDAITINETSYTKSLFVTPPGVVDNPDKSGINKSDKCLGAVNVANADWSGNRVELKLKEPIKIKSSNSILSFLAYRSIQPKEMRIGFNDYEEIAQIYFDKTYVDKRWDRIIIDLGESYMGKTLNSIWILFSCNWYAPRTGWGEAEYCFDDFTLYSRIKTVSEVVIDPTEEYQTIEDFGASDCWTADVVGKYWGDQQKEYIATKLFSREFDTKGNPMGIGLSNWRVNLGAGTSEQGDDSGLEDIVRRTECFLQADGTYNWEKQAGQQYFMQKAKEFGCENFLFFSNTPPVYFTKNGKGFANKGESSCNLLSTKVTDFGEFMATVGEHFRDEGYNIKYISPVNEPQYDWTEGQEGSPWQNADIKKVAVALNNSLQQRESSIQIMLSEAGSFDKLYGGTGRAANQIYNLFDPKSSNYVGDLPSVAPLVAGHSYWTFSTNATLKNVRTELWDEAKQYNLKTFQTEWSLLDAAPTTDTGFPESYDAASYTDLALFMGKLIHCDLAFANVSSWSYWTALATEVYSQKTRFMLMRLTPSNGAGGYDPYASLFNGGKVEATPNLWALGNYSLFIRPGYKRIRLDGANNMNQVLGTAYISPDGSELVVVYINTSSIPHYIRTDFSGLEGIPEKIRKYTTSLLGGMLRDQNLSEEYTGKDVILTSRSINTLVYDINKSGSSVFAPENSEEPAIIVSPNPIKADAQIQILIPALNSSSDKIAISVYEVTGRLVYNNSQVYNEGAFFTLPQGTLPGVYILNIVTCGKNYQHKLMVQ